MGTFENNSYRTGAPGIIKSALKNAPMPVAILEGFELVLTYANKALFEVWGKGEDIIGKQLLDILPELHNQPFPALLKQVLLTGNVIEESEALAYVIKSGKREKIYFDYSYTPIEDEEGTTIGVLVVATDVTEKVLAKKRVEESEKHSLNSLDGKIGSVADDKILRTESSTFPGKLPEFPEIISFEISQAQKNLEMALRAGSMGYFEVDLATGAMVCTDQCKVNYGFPLNTVLNREKVHNVILPFYHDQIEEKLRYAIDNHTTYNAEFEIARPDKSVHWIKVTAYALYNHAGEPVTLCGVNVDITEAIQAEEKRSRLAAIINSSDDTIISKTLQGIITSWNPAAERMFGYKEDEVIGKHISILIPEDLQYEEDIIISNIAAGNKVDHFETTRVTKDGRRINILLSVSPVRDSTGKIIGASKIARDITESRKVHEKQAILAAIVDSSDDTILSKTLQGIITSWNPAAQRMFGYTENEVIGKHISLLIPPDLLFEEEVIIGNIAKGNKVDHFETVRVTKDGRLINISISVSPIRDAKGKIIGASKIARDITEQKKAEKRLRSYANTLETINELCKTISEELNAQKLMQLVIAAAARVTGAASGAFFYNSISPEGKTQLLYSFLGTAVKMYGKADQYKADKNFFKTTFDAEIIKIDNIDDQKDSSSPLNKFLQHNLSDESYLSVPVLSKTGVVVGTLLLGHKEASGFTTEHEDIVLAIASQASIALENARLFEEVKVLSTKKDEFIGMASHELKTPLTSMFGYLQILLRMQTDEKSSGFVKKIIHQTRKLLALVNDILDISKIEAGKLQFTYEKFNISKLLLEIAELIQLSSPKHTITINQDLPELCINGDRNRIEQLIINLLTNAVKYSPKANAVNILVEDLGDKVQVGVRDYGIGIPAEKVVDIFSRFYTVDGVNSGLTGLGIGLYLSKEIVDRHHGKIWAETEEGKGSTFWFLLNKA